MTDPQFIPSGLPHSVEMPDGSSLAKSKSRKIGDDVRRTEENLQEIPISADHVVLQARNMAVSQAPRNDGFQRATDAIAPWAGQEATEAGEAPPAPRKAKVLYDTAMVEMDFPARFIQLKIDNDRVRAELQVLESQLRDNNEYSPQ